MYKCRSCHQYDLNRSMEKKHPSTVLNTEVSHNGFTIVPTKFDCKLCSVYYESLHDTHVKMAKSFKIIQFSP